MTSSVPQSERQVLIAQSGLFDPAWYLKHNPDVAAAGMDPLHHYLSHGEREGRNPSADFDVTWYAKKYPAFESTGLGALEHYLLRGLDDNNSANLNEFRERLKTDRSLAQEQERYSLAALPIFIVPKSERRINLVVDSTSASFAGGADSLEIAAMLSNNLGASLRVITRTERFDERSFKIYLSARKTTIPARVEFFFCDYLSSTIELGASKWDIFMTEGEANAIATRASLAANVIIPITVAADFMTPRTRELSEQIAPEKFLSRITSGKDMRVQAPQSVASIVADLSRSCESVYV